MGTPLKKAADLLAQIQPQSRATRMERSCELAQLLMQATLKERTSKEKARENWLAKMMQDPKGRVFMTEMTDRCFRSSSNARTADQLVHLLKKHGVPKFLPETDRVKMIVFRFFGRLAPNFFMPLVKKQLMKEMSPVLLPEDPTAFFKNCRESQIRINVNHLGEAILGEEEADRRTQVYLDDLKGEFVDYISIKISTVYSQINVMSFDQTLDALIVKVKPLYIEAQKRGKFVNLDMEEFRDLDLTVALFKRILCEPEFRDLPAGIVLQSYLPQSFAVQQELSQWAKERGGAPIKIRLVKGANLSMEALESSLRHWEQAPFDHKVEADANFKRMLEFGMQHLEHVHLGIASHNLFDLAYALILCAEHKSRENVQFEMLKGMAEPMHRALHKLTGSMLLYCPEAKPKDFQYAVAYLIRRLDENTGPENFLRHIFELSPTHPMWEEQERAFLDSCNRIDTLQSESRRQRAGPFSDASFDNEPDTDFSMAENRVWAQKIFATWKNKEHPTIPCVIAGQERQGVCEQGVDPSRPDHSLYSYVLADEKMVDEAFQAATPPPSFPAKKIASLLRERRDDLIGAMIADGGKTVEEADVEISEAIDFVLYYCQNWEKLRSLPGISWEAKGIILVAPPWNFPCSIPTGGIAAALIGGNSVLFKPAPEAVLIGWHLVQIFWEAGISKTTLQFLNCQEVPVGEKLIQDPRLAAVILTGATTTAELFGKLSPGLDLMAETGGKNALIVSSMSDRDLAIRDIVHSAFGHGGQKCSACSLAILEAEVYDNPEFRRQLRDAAQSLPVGSAWNPSTKVPPLIHPPEGALKKALSHLDASESWLLAPKMDPKNPRLWSPGIKWGVVQGSFMHQTELFGPILGVMRADNLEHAIELANDTPYGLTSGLHSLDEREKETWTKKIMAGNLYINRSITGAIVRRQPFGGCKASSFGLGCKAGGPNYMTQMAHPEQIKLPTEKGQLPQNVLPLFSKMGMLTQEESRTFQRSVESYAYWAPILCEPVDPSTVLGQDNLFYHVPLPHLLIRAEDHTPMLDILRSVAACLICKTPCILSLPKPIIESCPGVEVICEEESAFLQRAESKVRVLHSPSQLLKESDAILLSNPVLATGRIELLNYLREVALSHDFHRYGYLGSRA